MLSRTVVGLCCSCVVGALSIAYATATPKETPADRGEPLKSAAQRELEAVLGELARTWNPRTRATLTRRCRGRSERFAAPLLRLLGQPEHALVVEAIYLAQELPVRATLPLLRRLAASGPEHVRPAALAAANGIEPWSSAELAAFLDPDRIPAVLLTTLEIVRSRADPPLPEVFALLVHDDEDVRTAALRAIPPGMPPENARNLLDFARRAEGSIEPCVLLALGSIVSLLPETEDLLVDQLDSGDHAVRTAALEALSAKDQPLRRPLEVLALTERSSDPVEQARAFYCLERTRSPGASKFVGTLDAMDPLPRYFAARYLAAEGKRQGVRTLMQILDTGRVGVRGDRDEQILAETRVVLTSMFGNRSLDREALWAWLAQQGAAARQPLPPSSIRL